MAELLELDNLYEHLEERAIDYKYRDMAETFFPKVRNKKHVAKKPDFKAIAQWEMNVFNFSFPKMF